MGLFGKSEDSAQSRSLWSRLTKQHRKQEQKYNTVDSPSVNQANDKQQAKQQKQTKPPIIRISDEERKDNFRLSLQSLRPKSHISSSNSPQNRASCLGTEQLDSRLRTSKLQCEQLKRKVATISLECSKLESQCSELREVKEQLLAFQTDITMLKRKEKGYFEIQQRIGHLEDENFAMIDQIEHLRVKLSELKTEIRPELIYKRLDQLESDDHKLTSLTLQNRRDHDRFSLDVGNQLVETFVTQQTIYEEFRRLQHRLVSVERQNQIMSDLIHFHCHNSAMGGTRASIENSPSSRGPASMQASTEAASSSFSPTFSDPDAEKTYTSPSNIDWQFTDQADSLFICDTLNKSSEENRESMLDEIKSKDYYKIDFTTKSESLTTLHLTDLSAALSASLFSTAEDTPVRPTTPCDIQSHSSHNQACTDTGDRLLFGKCTCDSHGINTIVTQQRDDGYYSTSHDGTMATDSVNITDSVLTQRTVAIFRDTKERYLILTRHVQKSRGRSLRFLPLFKSNCAMVIKSSMDLETHMSNRWLRQRQRKQRESQSVDEDDDDVAQVFSDTELYGTRFCIDSDIDEDDTPVALFPSPRLRPLKRYPGYSVQKSNKTETKRISNLPPLIEHVSERERKIEIKSSRKSRIVPPRVRPKLVAVPDSVPSIVATSTDQSQEPKPAVSNKPPKCCPSSKSSKIKCVESPKSSPGSASLRKVPLRKTDVKPPPIPPRPKKRMDLASLDYVNDPPIRMSPEGCQDAGSSQKLVHQFRDFGTPPRRMWRHSLSPQNDDCYMEDEDEDGVRITIDQEYYDQEFIAELENYQLPRSTVDRLVMQHFK